MYLWIAFQSELWRRTSRSGTALLTWEINGRPWERGRVVKTGLARATQNGIGTLGSTQAVDKRSHHWRTQLDIGCTPADIIWSGE